MAGDDGMSATVPAPALVASTRKESVLAARPRRFLAGLALVCLLCLPGAPVLGAGGGLNVVVMVNQDSSESVQLGNYYCERRQVPPQNLLRINWAGPNTEWALPDFATTLLDPLLSMLSSRQLTNQVDYVVLSMDIPYQVSSPNSVALNSTTSALFYGFKPDANDATCSLAPGSDNLYAGSEDVFRATPPIQAGSNSWLATMITSSNLAMAMQIVDQGVASDATFPTQTVYLQKSFDVARNVRYVEFDNAIFDTRLRGNYSLVRTNESSIQGYGYILGAQTGLSGYLVTGVSFAPGAIADNLTSFGGYLFQSSGQLDLLSLLAAGATASYGTIQEPCNYLQKFPAALDYLYQARGFSLAECYYQALTNPYQGVIVGEPLAAPFALPAAGAWANLPTNALLSGTTNLSLEFDAISGGAPLEQVDLFVDGLFFQTLTTVTPSSDNVLNVTLNGQLIEYDVPGGATLDSLASGLAKTLNASANLTKVAASAYGDRVELQSTDLSRTASQLSLAASSVENAPDALTTFITPDNALFIDTIAYGIQSFTVTGNPNVGDYLLLSVTKTNGAVVSVGVTNTVTNAAMGTLLQDLFNLVNSNPTLQGSDGLQAEDFYGGDPDNPPQFNLEARSLGIAAAQIQAQLSGSPDFNFNLAGQQQLKSNLPDLQPRAQLYITAGAFDLPLTFALDTTRLTDGFHQLTAVAYEGSNVRTQTRITQTVRVQNTALSATLSLGLGASNVAVEAVLPFSVAANSSNVTAIELFSTGGSLGAVAGQQTAEFFVSGTNLDVGLHPFYALVTPSTGAPYRTQTLWIRLVGPDSSFPLSFAKPPPRVSWPATAGRSYDILTASNLANPFQVQTTVIPTNSLGLWTDPNGLRQQQFYQVRTSSP